MLKLVIFIYSLFGAFVGGSLGGSLGGNEIFAGIGAFIGFWLPYAIVIERIYEAVTNKRSE